MENEQLHLIFLCVSNRGRSVFAEFFFRDTINNMGKGIRNRVKVTSAGFVPQAIKDQVGELQIGFPDPFYGRPMAEPTRSFLLERGISAPQEWRSRELTSEMVRDAHLIITAIPQQKEDLVNMYPEANAKICTMREISRWDTPFSFEDLTQYPKDESYWMYCEEDEEFVKNILSEVEQSLTQALPDILSRLGCGDRPPV